jgi:uncharacterized protein YfdQ (DUF2303 family)
MSDFKDALEAGKQHEFMRRIDDLPVVALQAGYQLHDITKFLPTLPAPVDKRGVVTLHTPQAFVTYVDAYRDRDTLVLTDVTAATVKAVIDYHKAGEDGAPRHGKHIASFACRHTKEWATWSAAHKKAMSQVDFAQFLEDNLPDIAAPAGGLLLEMARTIEVKKDVAFASSVRLQDGQQQLTYNENIEGSTSRGSLRLFETITLGIAPFEGSSKYELQARLRFRMNDGKLSLWFDLVRAHKVLEDAFAEVLAVITAGLPDARIVAGAVGRLAE